MSAPLDHAATEAGFHAALWAPDTPAGLGGATTDARRFAVYRNNVQHGLTRALAVRFPVIERLVGPDFFAAMARVFAAQHPPRTPVLHEWGDAFPTFLAGFEPVADLPYLPDVACLELARGGAYHAADAAVADATRLTALRPETLRLTLAPSVRGVASPWPAVSIWQANQPGATPGALPPGPEYALIARAPTLETLVLRLDPAMHCVLRALLKGNPLAKAAAGADPTPLLALLIQHDLIASIDGDPL